MERQLVLKNKKVLRLTLSKLPFELMVTGEKKIEYRKPSKWILSRLFEKDGVTPKEYDLICFTHGYGSHRPYFICEYWHFIPLHKEKNHYIGLMEYANGLKFKIEEGDIAIACGKIILKGNLNK